MYEVTGEWRRLHNEEFYDLDCSLNIVWMIKSRRRWVGHVHGEGRYIEGWWENLKQSGHLEDQDIDGRIILKLIFRKCDGGHGLDWSGSEYEQVADSCECGNEPLASIKRREFLD